MGKSKAGSDEGIGGADQAARRSKSHKSKKDKSKKEHKKHKKEHRHKRSVSSDSSSSDSDSEALLSPRQQLKREREAVTCLRDLLWLHQGMRKDLRELLWTVDQGKAANLAGVADEDLRQRLTQLLKLLGLRSTSAKGSYVLPKGVSPTLGMLGFVFEEQPRPPPAPKPKPTAPDPVKASAQPAAQSDQQGIQQRQQLGVQRGQQESQRGGGTSQAEAGRGQSGQGRHEGGPVPGSIKAEPEGDASTDPSAAPIRRMGPAMPDPEMLAAAALEAEAMAMGEEAEEPGAGPSLISDANDLVGPPPPELVDEMEAMPEDARDAEVVRITRLLKQAAITQPEHSLLAAAPSVGQLAGLPADVDAYAVLGLAADVAPGEVKKRFMRLSLLIHPDKCHHKDAHTAFQAVASAAKALQDSSSRAAIDEAVADKRLRAQAIEAAIAEERARQWRVARGEEAPGPPINPLTGKAQAPVRDSWMTDLPAERTAPVGTMSQVSQTAFSARGITSRGDTTDWTSTPQSLAAAAAGGGTHLQQGAAGTLMLTGKGMAGRAAGTGQPSAMDAKILDAFNSQARKKTLLEQHLDSEKQGSKAKKQKVEEPKVAGQPWRPFDREKDLQLKPKAMDPNALLTSQGALSSKFSSSSKGGTRHFL